MVPSSHLASLHLPLLADPLDRDPFDLQFVAGDGGAYDFAAIFADDPPWASSLVMADVVGEEVRRAERLRRSRLRRRQVKVETEAWEAAAAEYRELQREMCEKGLAPNLPYVKSLFLGWFEPLRDAIGEEQRAQAARKQKASHAPYIKLLPADKMAVIVMHKVMGLLMTNQEEGCVKVVQAAVHIGEAVEHEVRIMNFFDKIKKPKWSDGIQGDCHLSLMKDQAFKRKRLGRLIKGHRCIDAQKFLKKEGDVKPWGRDAQAKLGCRLIELLIESAFVQPPSSQLADTPPEIRPAFIHTMKNVGKEPGRRFGKRYGVIECDPLVCEGLDRTARHVVIPYMPMLVSPKKWKSYDKGGHLFLPSYAMRTHGVRQQQDAFRNVPRNQLKEVFKALDTLGSTKWRVNTKILGVIDKLWANGGGVAGLIDRADVPVPPKPGLEDPIEINKWRWNSRKAKKINSEMHAQRCDTELKLSVAHKMKEEEGFYYPHNLDFRGRAYPMHPHLSHLSSDLCRGILEFAEGKPLGRSGLKWLKIHLANLYGGGVEKLSYDRRLGFVERHLHDIIDSAERPIDGKRWWIDAEDPFQCLATCMDLSNALKSSSPYSVISHLPVHQDGSCNGLQHYAALGRDSCEAAAVNLVAGESPADVYSGIASRVFSIIKKVSEKDPASDANVALAKILFGQVDRKLVKQTVMTSVYGVTYVGAREQIRRRLEEKGCITDERLMFNASCYAANVTLTALGEMFQAARGIMRWLGDCAKVIASENESVRWTTPLGLPVVQPYRKCERHLIRTSLQVLALQREGDRVDLKRQRTAFPPNFVHSLDGSHMMMTAIACRDAGLHFAGVHDSFWTHASDVDKMNAILREKFVELYNVPILENLLESFEASFPTLTFPSLPDRGDFDLNEVLRSPYFFN